MEPNVLFARWSLIHAGSMLLATAVSWASGKPGVVLFLGGLSLLGLVLMARPYWTATGAFGWPNTVTALRLAGIMTLPFFRFILEGIWVFFFGLLLFVADGLDGWLARRSHQASEFGEYFDKETDAFFLLVLCILTVLDHRLGPWIIVAGILRYIFVILIHFSRPNLLKEDRSGRARIIYGVALVAMLLSFLPYPSLYKPLVPLAMVSLLLSFAVDFYLGFSSR